jgi:hypothetical protein
MKWLEYLKVLPLIGLYILGIIFFGGIVILLTPVVLLFRFLAGEQML